MLCTQGDWHWHSHVIQYTIHASHHFQFQQDKDQDRYISRHEGGTVDRMDLNVELWNNASDPENSVQILSPHWITVTRCQCGYLYPAWCGQEAPVRLPYYWLQLSATLVCVKFLQRPWPPPPSTAPATAGYMETCCTGHHWRHHAEPAQVSTLYLQNISFYSLNIFS